MDNQVAAQLLFNHKLATREQIVELWPLVTPEKDIAALLVERGLLARETYQQLLAYIRAMPSHAAHSAQTATATATAPEPKPKEAPASRPRQDTVGEEKEPSWTPSPDRPSDRSAEAREPARPATLKAPSGPIGAGSSWQDLLMHARRMGASDIHLSSNNPILVRRFGSLQPLSPEPLGPETVQAWVESALDRERAAEFDARGDLEFVYEQPGVGRYRATFLKQRRGPDITVRIVPDRIRTFEETGLPESCRELTQWAQGMVLVTGPVGCGKSSTLAALVDLVNQDRHDHIITLEDPIEMIYPAAKCRITQRQVGRHTKSQDAALRAALREDPDIIVISELRDLETIRLAVSAAETGHLVFGTMNTANAARTLFRLIDSFPPEEQGVVRNMISESLRGVISQQLLPLADGTGMVPAFEVLLVTSAVANMIRKDEAHQLGTAMLTGKSQGMVILDDSLKALVEKGLVDPREAQARASNPKDFDKYAGRGGR